MAEIEFKNYKTLAKFELNNLSWEEVTGNTQYSAIKFVWFLTLPVNRHISFTKIMACYLRQSIFHLT